jgi:hypothetical protein
MSDGSVAQGVVPINTAGQVAGGDVAQAIPDTNSAAEVLALYGGFQSITAGDFVTRKAASNGQVIMALSVGPLIEDAESNITVDIPVTQPAALEIEASMSQRVRHQFASIYLFANDDAGPFPVPADIEIASVYQSSADAGVAYNAVAGTILTIVLKTALPAGVYLSDWVHTYGLVDNRLNYPNLAIKFISYDRKTITCGFSDDAALPSRAVAAITPPNGSAFIKFYNNLGGAANGFGMRFTGTSATQAALVSIFGGGANDVQISGTLLGDHRVTVGSTAPIYANGVNGNVEIRATSRYRLEGRPRDCAWYDTATDTAAVYTARAIRTSVKPAVQVELRPRFRAYRPKSMTRPVAKIVSISKSGTTTATVNTASAHGLTTGNWVSIRGVRDQTNFANISTVQVTVINATQFTLVLGSAVTATSYGGAVILTNGGVDQQGALGQVVQSASVAAETGVLTLVGNTNWSGVNIGDYVELYGLRDNTTGADLGLDGAWEVAALSTTSLNLVPVVDIFGARVSPNVTSLASTDCGGQVIQRTTLRAHDILLEDWSENRVMIDGAGTPRLDRAVPVRILAIDSAPTLTANEGTPNAGTDYAMVSAATTNGASVKATAGNLFELSLFNVTAATVYLKLYNKTSAPTVGTDVPIMTIPVAAGALYSAEFGRLGKRFSTGIALAITGAAVATDTTAVAAGAQLAATYV